MRNLLENSQKLYIKQLLQHYGNFSLVLKGICLFKNSGLSERAILKSYSTNSFAVARQLSSYRANLEHPNIQQKSQAKSNIFLIFDTNVTVTA